MNMKHRWIVILIIAALVLLGPYMIEVHYDPLYGHLELSLYSWLWIFAILGGAPGFRNVSGSIAPQMALMHTGLQIVFLFALIAYIKDSYSRKDTIYVGLASAVPGLFVASVQVGFFFLLLGGPLDATIPLLLPTIIGLVLLKLEGDPEPTTPW